MIKLKISITLFFLSLTCIFAQDDSYKLVWAEEFDADAINASNWNFETGGNGWGNLELQYYTDRDDNAFIRDGKLVIKAKKEVYQNCNYTSARLTTKDKAFVKYGKIEASIKLPSGTGTWPAFWMMPQSSVYGSWPRSGEIDIMEHVGYDPDMISFAIHTRNQNGSSGNNWYSQVRPGNVEQEFHLYSIEWLEDRIAFYIDGVKEATYWNDLKGDYRTWPFDQEFFVILNMALGGKMGGNIDDNIFNSDIEMEVDYVRIYQKNTGNSLSENTLIDHNVKVNKESQILRIENISQYTQIRLYTVDGLLLINSKTINNSEYELSTSSLSSGVYLLSVSEQEQTKTYKIAL